MRLQFKPFTESPRFARYARNTSWMFAEYGLRVVSGIFVTVLVARHLGPEQFGLLAYLVAVTAVAALIARLGLDAVLVRDVALHVGREKEYLSAGFSLMLFASIAALLTIGGVASVSGVDPSTQRYMVVMALGLLFQPFLVVDYGFQGRVQAKYSAIAKVTALALGSSLKLILVILDAHLSLLVFAYAVDPVLLAATLWLVRASQSPAGLFCRFDPNLLRSMWASAWPLMLSAAAAVLHVRIDQLMIMAMLGSEQLGLYASVGKIFEAWSLIPYLITISLLPALTRLRAEGDAVYQRNLVRLLSLVFWMGIGFAFAVWIVGDGLVRLLFGDEFVAAYEALKIMAVGAALVGFASVTARFLAVENMEGSIALRASAALAVNVSCNIILIPRFGIEGAALSSVISVFIAHYLLDYFGARTRSLLRMKHLAIVLPLNKSPRKYGVT